MAMQTQQQLELILASSSPRRQELIRALGLPYSVQPSDADETVPPGWPPDRIVEQLALRKADAVARGRRSEGKDGIVVGSDTIVVLDGAVLGKPENEADAERALTALQGRSHEVYTGVALVQVSDGRTAVSHRATVVHMKPCSTERIRRYIATGEPMDKAGSYGIQGVGATLVERIEGCYFNVVGLPLSLLTDMLEPFGIRVP
ncbi:Maf-like protein [Paenibacillus dendritiformis]|nr:Maf-like protein [Paenibacillus dendritiformis]